MKGFPMARTVSADVHLAKTRPDTSQEERKKAAKPPSRQKKGGFRNPILLSSLLAAWRLGGFFPLLEGEDEVFFVFFGVERDVGAVGAAADAGAEADGDGEGCAVEI